MNLKEFYEKHKDKQSVNIAKEFESKLIQEPKYPTIFLSSCSAKIKNEFKACDEFKDVTDFDFIGSTYINFEQQMPEATLVYKIDLAKLEAYTFVSPFRVCSISMFGEKICLRVAIDAIKVDERKFSSLFDEQLNKEKEEAKRIEEAQKKSKELEEIFKTLTIGEKQFAFYNGMPFSSVAKIQAIKEAYIKTTTFTFFDRLKALWSLLIHNEITSKLGSRILHEINEEYELKSSKFIDAEARLAEMAIINIDDRPLTLVTTDPTTLEDKLKEAGVIKDNNPEEKVSTFNITKKGTPKLTESDRLAKQLDKDIKNLTKRSKKPKKKVLIKKAVLKTIKKKPLKKRIKKKK